MSIDMAIYKRINITLHPEDLRKLDEIAKKREFTRSAMISRLIQGYDAHFKNKETKK
jgi:metal-responsive CopG/Arc/MetJ family transcriptional regulator